MEQTKQQQNANKGSKKSQAPKQKPITRTDLEGILKKIHTTYQDKVKTPKDAMDLYKTDQGYKTEIDSIPKSKGILGRLERFVGEKYMAKVYKELTINPAELSTMEKIKNLEIIGSDDLASILGVASTYLRPALVNLATEQGPAVISWLYNKFKNMFNKQGHGSGPGQHSFVSLNTISLTDNNTINPKYLASMICPEVYCEPMSSSNDPYVVSTSKEVIFPIYTGSDGNAFAIVMDDAVCVPGANPNYYTATTVVGSTYNPTTGVIGGNGLSYLPGPFNSAGVTNISTFRLTAAAYRFVPSVSSLNNAGKVSFFYNTQSTNLTIGSNNPTIPGTTLLQSPILHIAPLKSPEFRQISIMNDVVDTVLDPFQNILTSFGNNGYKFAVLTVTGALVNTQIGDLYCQANIDYTPGDSLTGIVKPLPTPDAPGTLMCFASMIKQFPQVTNLNCDEAKTVAQYIRECPQPTYSAMMSHIQSKMLSFKKKPLSMANPPQQEGIGNMSFDIIQE